MTHDPWINACFAITQVVQDSVYSYDATLVSFEEFKETTPEQHLKPWHDIPWKIIKINGFHHRIPIIAYYHNPSMTG